MTKSLVILGRQPALGLAELEAKYGAEAIEAVHGEAAVLSLDAKAVAFTHLGGTIKLCTLLGSVDSIAWDDISQYLADHIAEFAQEIPEGKIILGISLFGLKAGSHTINATALSLKKELKAAGRSCRVVPNKSPALNSAQVLYNKLATEKGCELVLVKAGTSTLVARTVHEQDIDAYAARDQARPARDAKVGMLPPKLAQIIINLCNPAPGGRIIDPFCGTGVLLQEALLMGMNIQGSDLDPRMVDYTAKNLQWLSEKQNLELDQQFLDNSLQVADAVEVKLSQYDLPESHIACETYLGRPFSTTPDRAVLNQVVTDVDTIHRKFLRNIAKQTKSGFRMCIAVPAWRVGRTFKHLPTLDQLDELGYTRLVFKHVEPGDLIYHREGQVVARELVVLKRK